MIPLNENDPKTIAMVENIPELGKVKPYQVEDGAVMVANEHAICRISHFTALHDGHYYFNHEIEATGQTLSTYFKIRPNPEATIHLPLEVVKRMAEELRVWSKGLGRGLFVELIYEHDDKEGVTRLVLNTPGETNKVADKKWSYSWERAGNENYFRAVCNSNQLMLVLSIFSKMKDTENLPVPIQLNYDPKAFENKGKTGKPTYNGIWFLDAHYLGHFVSSGYSTTSICTPKDQEEGGLIVLIEEEEKLLESDAVAQILKEEKPKRRKRKAVAADESIQPEDVPDAGENQETGARMVDGIYLEPAPDFDGAPEQDAPDEASYDPFGEDAPQPEDFPDAEPVGLVANPAAELVHAGAPAGDFSDDFQLDE